MPRVKVDYIVSFSSEDPDNPASNLLSWDVSKKRWLCPKGEPSCSVVLQLAKAIKISAVHVGAHQAALVEVLVGRSETPQEPFQVLVPRCVFLSPHDSRRGDAAERVRSFTSEQLTDARHQRWDRMRIECLQPYNKHCKFGLNFVQVYEYDSAEVSKPVSNVSAEVSKLSLNVSALKAATDNSDDEDQFRPGELFAQFFKARTPDTGAQIRQATSQALKNISDSATKLVKNSISKHSRKQNDTEDDYGGDRQRDDLLYDADDIRPHGKIDIVVQRHKEHKAKDDSGGGNNKQGDKLNGSVKDKHERKHIDKSKTEKYKHNDSIDRNDTKESKYNEKAEKYKNNGSTYKSNKEKGHRHINDSSERKDNKHSNKLNGSKILYSQDTGYKNSHSESDNRKVKVETINKDKSENKNSESECVKNETTTSLNGKKRPREQKRRQEKVDLGSVLSGVVFVMSGYVNPERAQLRDLACAMGARCLANWGPSCTHLLCAFPNTPKLRAVRGSPGGGAVPAVRAAWLRACHRRRARLPWTWYATEDKFAEPPETSSDDQSENDAQEDDDTDDEIQRVVHQSKRARTSSSRNTPAGPEPPEEEVGDSTDDDTDLAAVPRERIDPDKALPSIFSGLTFVVQGVTAVPTDLLRRYVTGYGGLLLEECELEAETEVDYVISSKPGTSSRGTPGARSVSPAWLWRCHQDKKLLPH